MLQLLHTTNIHNMGCASSSPVVNGEGVHSATGSMAETMAEQAKSATNNAIEAGEQVLNGKYNFMSC